MKRRHMIAFATLALLLCGAGAAAEPTLAEAYRTLASKRFVDLTHAFEPGIPHWKGFTDERITTLYTEKQHGFTAHEYCHVGQWGTHVDPPSHFHANFPSYAVGRLKPDADYFEHVLETLDVAPEQALFIDDNALNVEAAARLGINARKAIGPAGVRAVLRELELL